MDHNQTTELEEILISKQYNTDKNSEYLRNYERHFRDLKREKIALLELGIFKGGSLYMWRDYFRNGRIVGLDMNPIELNDESGRIRLYRGRQQDTHLLDKIRRETAKDGFDIIIDDASHLGEATKISFWHLFSHHLKPGGIYIIEDWRTGYWQDWYDGKRFNLSKHDRRIRSPFHRFLDHKLDNLAKHENPEEPPSLKRRVLTRLRNAISKKRFKNHDTGMVGFVKELVDEVGMDAITNPKRGSRVPKRENKITNLEFTPGQVFVFKNE